MKPRYQPVDLSRLKTYSAQQRRHKAGVDALASLPPKGASASELIASFPNYLGAKAFRQVVIAMVDAARHRRPVVAAVGAHVLKVGCGPILIDLIQRGIITTVAGHGATAIHDVEMATLGQTSEEVADTIRDGRFGMVAETMNFFEGAAQFARKQSLGLGAAIGQLLIERDVPFRSRSVFAAARAANIPACVHVALGTDTIHASSGLDIAALAEASMLDFRLLCDVVRDLGTSGNAPAGGVWLNIGSAVVMPEVFLKAVAIARNLGANLDAMTTANFDMIRHYRPHQNVLVRPVAAGRGLEVVGQHEILLPLLRQAIVEELDV